MSDTEKEKLIKKHLAQKKDKFEALGWLKGSNSKSYRYLAEWTNEESIKVIEEIYNCGAKEVWAVAFDRNRELESINTLIVTLPEIPEKREDVLRWVNDRIEQQGFDREEDEGQRYLYLWFD